MVQDPARWRLAKEIFSDALEAEPHGRSELIRQRCGSDRALVHQVEELLALHGEDGLALDQKAPVAVGEFFDRSPSPPPRFERHREGEVLAGRYRVGKRIGGGGMGEVYRATDQEQNQLVAIKTVRPFVGDAGQAEARFLREVRMAQKISHPNVCRVLALAEHEGERFCVMEMLEGETLAERLQSRGRMKPEEALPVAVAVCDGLAAAHAAGVIHRDLKPGNILLAGGRAVIIDFGLAAGLAHDRSLTADGEVIGTLAYMAPEQLEEGASSPASDLYALGVVMYEMLTGQKPHGARSPFRLAAQKARESHRTPKLTAAGVPRVWHEVIERCLRANPKERFHSAAQVKQALERGRASLRFLLLRPRVLVPAVAAMAAVAASLGWYRLSADYVPAPEAGRLYEQAQAALAEAAPLRATKLLEQAVARDPAFLSARSLLAAAYAELDQPERAREAVLEAAGAAEQRWSLGRGEKAGLRAARAAVVRDHKQAAGQYRNLAALVKGPSATFALVAAARSMEQAGDRDGALRTLESAVKSDPGNSAARVRLGMSLSRVKQHDRARAEFLAAEQAYERSKNLEGLSDLLLARSSSRLGGYEADRRDIERVLALSEKTGNRYHNLSAKLRMAVLSEQQRDYDGAVRIAREAADQARREGMPIVAAQALGELGYAFLYMKRPELGVPILQESVEMAERAKATGTLAQNRMRLGEVLGNLKRADEAVAAMEPAVAWLRQSGNRDSLPLTLMKWGTILSSTPRFAEVEGLCKEALDLATADGNEMFQSMALDRLGSYLHPRDLAKAAQYWERAVPLARKTRLIRVFFLAARTTSALGQFQRTEELLREGEAEIRKHPPGVDRVEFESLALATRASAAYRQGDCAAAESLAREAVKMVPGREHEFHRLRACSSDREVLRRSLAWVEPDLAKRSSPYDGAAWGGTVALMYLGLGNTAAAKSVAAGALTLSKELQLHEFTLESSLVLRAAERKLGNATEAGRLTAQCVELARRIGFDPPETFGGRRDLLRLWNAGNQR